jgi:dipeptidyl aminopeptidase/acylaminoacyl peptidase
MDNPALRSQAPARLGPDGLRVAAVAAETRGPAVVEDVIVASPGIGEVEAYLVRPADPTVARGPGLVWWHWLDTEAPDGNRTEFLDEAIEWAGCGAVSVLPQGRFPWTQAPDNSSADTAAIADEVLRLRHCLDVLVARSDVDASKLAVVGHDYGAMFGLLALAFDRRPRGAVALAVPPRWGDWNLPFWRIEEDRIDYLRALRPFDPIEHVASIAPRPLLFQSAEQDFYLAPMATFELRRAAGETAEAKHYPGGHDLKVPAARDDRRSFLERLLA